MIFSPTLRMSSPSKIHFAKKDKREMFCISRRFTRWFLKIFPHNFCSHVLIWRKFACPCSCPICRTNFILVIDCFTGVFSLAFLGSDMKAREKNTGCYCLGVGWAGNWVDPSFLLLLFQNTEFFLSFTILYRLDISRIMKSTARFLKL